LLYVAYYTHGAKVVVVEGIKKAKCQCGNMQMGKWANGQMEKCAKGNVEMCRFADVQMVFTQRRQRRKEAKS
jgi:hypothetical protein